MQETGKMNWSVFESMVGYGMDERHQHHNSILPTATAPQCSVRVDETLPPIPPQPPPSAKEEAVAAASEPDDYYGVVGCSCAGCSSGSC